MMKKSIFNMLNNFLYLPSPSNLSYLWNFGSMLGFCLMIQIITGLILSMNYATTSKSAFDSIIHIMQDTNNGWLIRYMHLNTASMFFFCMFMHIARNIYYNSFILTKVWFSGILIFFISMASAFLGYVLPWGQMSFWGATVITNLLSTIPYMGNWIVIWVWGGFSIDNPTLNRFFSLHFILPLVIFVLVMMHIFFLHETGSNNPLGHTSNLNKIPFTPYFLIKDLITLMLMLMIIMMMILNCPNFLNDPENFLKANPMVTPIHIQPEWYFLFAYAILRSIPSKLGGVIALLMSIMILFIMPILSFNKIKSSFYYPISQNIFWMFINTFILLTWIGMKEIKYPYNIIGQLLSITYFVFFFLNPLMFKWWENKNY
uniref:Cytochrome b n=1 Tax=Prosevania sp. ZJUH_2016031 TaxID=2491170 RepID=A0A3S8V1D2_9HYME|nr:cytochrome b [Prosevania sp. ZJUH_2016031]